MKALRAHIGFSLIFAVLFSILFQAFHIIDHASDDITPLSSEKQTALTASVSKCLVCDFKFSVFHTPEVVDFTPVEPREPVVYVNSYTPVPLTFQKGSLMLRAPPHTA